jgi:spermidine synthase
MVEQQTIGRNDPCPCGSGRKQKRCCGVSTPKPAEHPIRGLGIYAMTFVLAFCSIVYELLLGQALSAFLGNTVLRYSVTIGLYMLSMGMGALLARRRILEKAVVRLMDVELLLSVLGGASVLLFFAADYAGFPPLVFSAFAHSLIVAIGVLTGLEIPLLIEIRSGGSGEAASSVLGVDYVGAFAGTIAFAFWFYPRIGLVPTALGVASLNAAVGVLLPWFRKKKESSVLSMRTLLQVAVLLALVVGVVSASAISEFGIGLYLEG